MTAALQRSGSNSDAALKAYKEAVQAPEASIRDMRKAAKEALGYDLQWDWDLPRTREGYYHYQGGIPVSLPMEGEVERTERLDSGYFDRPL